MLRVKKMKDKTDEVRKFLKVQYGHEFISTFYDFFKDNIGITIGGIGNKFVKIYLADSEHWFKYKQVDMGVLLYDWDKRDAIQEVDLIIQTIKKLKKMQKLIDKLWQDS